MSKRLIYFEHTICDRWDFEQELIMEFDTVSYDSYYGDVIFLEMNSWIRLMYNNNNNSKYNKNSQYETTTYILQIGYFVDYSNNIHTLHKIKRQITTLIDILPDDDGINYLLTIKCGPEKIDKLLQRMNVLKNDWHYLNKLSTTWSNYIKDENYLIL